MDIYGALGGSQARLPQLFDSVAQQIKHNVTSFRDSMKDAVLSQPLAMQELRVINMGRAILDILSMDGSTGENAPADSRDRETKVVSKVFGEKQHALKRMPLAAAAVLHTVVQDNHQEAIKFCHLDGILIMMAHLYRACFQAGLLTAYWRDMECVLDQQGQKPLGLPEISSTSTPLLSAAKHYGMTMGVKLSAYGSDGRTKKVAADHRVALPALSYKVKQRAPKIGHGLRVVDKTLGRFRSDKNLGFEINYYSRDALYDLTRELLADDTSDISESIRNQWTTIQTLSPAQLLEVVKSYVQSSELAVHFPYRRLLLTSLELLETVREQYGLEITRSRFERGITGDFMLHRMVDEILWGAATEQFDGRAPKYCNLTTLKGVASILEDHILSSGSECINVAQNLTSGTLSTTVTPEHDTPDPTTSMKPVHSKLTLRNGEVDVRVKVHFPETTRDHRRLAILHDNQDQWELEGLDEFQRSLRAMEIEEEEYCGGPLPAARAQAYRELAASLASTNETPQQSLLIKENEPQTDLESIQTKPALRDSAPANAEIEQRRKDGDQHHQQPSVTVICQQSADRRSTTLHHGDPDTNFDAESSQTSSQESQQDQQTPYRAGRAKQNVEQQMFLNSAQVSGEGHSNAHAKDRDQRISDIIAFTDSPGPQSMLIGNIDVVISEFIAADEAAGIHHQALDASLGSSYEVNDIDSCDPGYDTTLITSDNVQASFAGRASTVHGLRSMFSKLRAVAERVADFLNCIE